MIVTIDDPQDLRLTDYRDLKDVKLRTHVEAELGVFMAESALVIERALKAGHQPRSVLVSQRWLESVGALVDLNGPVPIYVGTEAVLEAITGFHVHRGAMAAMHRTPLPELADILAGSRRIAILEDIVDHTNVGAVFRSAAALDVDAILISPRCADPLYRRSVRVSMGNVFAVPYTRLASWPRGLNLIHEAGFVSCALALQPDSLSLDELAANLPEKLALILGTEGHGLSARTLAMSHHTVMIPMSHGVDSLNVAAASAVAFWATRPAARV